MKVCQIIGGEITKVAGLEKHIIDLSNNLVNLCDTYVIAHKSYKKYFDTKVNFIELDLKKSRYNLFIYLKLFKILKDNNFDIVHTQANKATKIVSMLKPFFKKIKFIATLHNEKKDLSAFNSFDYVIGVSKKILKKVTTPKKVVYNGLNPSLFENITPLNLKKEFNIINKYPIAVCVGRYVKAKGMDILIEALKDINLNVLLVGDGPLRNELERQIVATKQNNKIFLTGFRNDVKNIVSSADFAIISSRNEGFPYVFTEIMHLQKPLVSTKVSDIEFFIPNKYLANLEDIQSLNEKIKLAIANIHTINNDFFNFHKEAKNNLTIETMSKENFKLYKKVINE